MLENIKKYWVQIVFVLGFFGSGITYIYKQGAKESDYEARMFKDAAQKVEVVTKVKNGLSPEQIQRKYFQDSLDKAHRIKSRAFRDSLDLLKARRDSLTAVTIYQIKQELKALKENE